MLSAAIGEHVVVNKTLTEKYRLELKEKAESILVHTVKLLSAKVIDLVKLADHNNMELDSSTYETRMSHYDFVQ